MGRAWAVVLALALVAPPLLVSLGSPGLVDPDEGRYGWAARAMARDGLSFTPEFNGRPRFAKPAPITWLQALSMRALGEGELALRLPGALLAVAAVLVVFRFVAASSGPWAGLLAAVVLGTGFRFVVIGRQALVDPPLQLCLAGAMVHLAQVVAEPAERRARHLLLAHLWMAAGVLLKGPVAVLVPWSALAVALAWGRRLDRLRGARVGRALLALAAVAGPYFAVMVAEHGAGYVREVVLRQHLERYFTDAFGQPSVRGPGYFLGVVPVDTMPWFPAMVLAVALLARSWRHLEPDERERMRFLVAWTVVVLVLFSGSRFKLVHYVLPAYLSLAAITGSVLGGRPPGRWPWRLGWCGCGLVVALALALAARYLAIGGFAWWPPAAVAAAAAVWSLAASRLGPGRAVTTALLVLVTVGYLALGLSALPVLDRYRPEAALAGAVPAGAEVGLYGLWSSAFVYYLGRPVEVIPDHLALARWAASGGERLVLTPLPLLGEVSARGGRILATGAVLGPRLEDLRRPRPPRSLGLVEVGR